MEEARRLPVEGDDEIAATLDDLARNGYRRMIAAALEAEVRAYFASLLDEVVRMASGWWFATGMPVSAS